MVLLSRACHPVYSMLSANDTQLVWSGLTGKPASTSFFFSSRLMAGVRRVFMKSWVMHRVWAHFWGKYMKLIFKTCSKFPPSVGRLPRALNITLGISDAQGDDDTQPLDAWSHKPGAFSKPKCAFVALFFCVLAISAWPTRVRRGFW